MPEEPENPERQHSPPKLAVALKIGSEGDPGPGVVASARGLLARRIVEIADEEGIPVMRDEELARSLSLLEVGSRLPPELFPAVAEIIAHIYYLSEKAREQHLTGDY
ncbi:MAG: EscU/YscU/HrcU family type III secretion system export apparatus switch protein [Planctomycetes bacterium]|nr:EscU/YscU/HrcU family type III secretion system export apparatus switch protein [Planctomycetota bacterium]